MRCGLCWRAALCGMLALVLLGSWTSSARAQEAERCFPETGYCVSGRFLEFWEQNGGLPVFGFPITTQQAQTIAGREVQVQYFERTSFELRPENARPYDVLLGDLGRRIASGLGPQPAEAPRADCRFFSETGFNVCDDMLATWQRSGLEFDGQAGTSEAESLALWGFPITGEFTATLSDGREYTVQYFERARFERHPENPAPFNILTGLLGSETLAQLALGGVTWQLESYGSLAQPIPAVDSTRATLTFGSDGRISGSTGCNGFGGGYSANANQIAFGQVISTLIACEDPLGQQEREVFQTLQGVARYELGEGTLRLFYNQDQSALVFRAAPATAATVTGTVTYRERIALPEGAVITVQLRDVSRQDAPAPVIAEQVITTTGEQVPIPFTLSYDAAQIDERYTYSVGASISIGGERRFISTEAYLVITQGRSTTDVEVVVQSIGGA